MGRYITASTKIRRELKEEAERLGINISEVMRKAIEDEVKRRRLININKELESLEDILSKINIDRVVESIREDRKAR